MSANIIKVSFGILYLISTSAFASGYSSNSGSDAPLSPPVSNPPSVPYQGHDSPPSAPPTYNPPSAPPTHHKKKVKAVIHVTHTIVNPDPQVPYYMSRTYPKGRSLQWISMSRQSLLPRDAVIGGTQAGNPHTLFICRGSYRGGMHPGKLVGGYCNISWGGQEIRLSHYQVLVSKIGLGWISTSNGDVPVNAIEGGYENGYPLYICQAEYRAGMYPGKIVGNMCNISWRGSEISVPYYNVLVR